MAEKGAFNIQLSGFTAANRDARVELENPATGQKITRAPFLDGSLLVRDLDPGIWNVKLTHPNLINPIFQNPVRVFPQPTPTFIPIPVPETIFRDAPIRDIPDADLGPVQQGVTSARDSLAPIQGKAPGEAIRAADWNALVIAVRDLSANVLELTRLVSPKGHNHPELEEKIAEVQGNTRSFTEAFGRSLLEFRRELEAAHFRNVVTGVLDAAQAPQATRDDLLGRVDRLTESLSADPSVFTAQLSSAGSQVLSQVATLVTANPELQANPIVIQTQATAQTYVQGGVATSAANELGIYARSNTAAAGGKFGTLLRR